jgi:ethanolamine utilization cobalamin adenosyltransferase
MKFITEMELRDLYKAEPFTAYVLEPNIKITPEARQFLVDRGVKLIQRKDGKDANQSKEKSAQGKGSLSVRRLRTRMDSLEAQFLWVGADLLSGGETVLAEEVLALKKCFRSIKNSEREQTVPDHIPFWDESDAIIKSFATHSAQSIEINDSHVRLKQGKAITQLNCLRASLYEIEAAILETYWNEKQQTCSREDLVEKVNYLNNVLCIMIWKSLGGTPCKP